MLTPLSDRTPGKEGAGKTDHRDPRPYITLPDKVQTGPQFWPLLARTTALLRIDALIVPEFLHLDF